MCVSLLAAIMKHHDHSIEWMVAIVTLLVCTEVNMIIYLVLSSNVTYRFIRLFASNHYQSMRYSII